LRESVQVQKWNSLSHFSTSLHYLESHQSAQWKDHNNEEEEGVDHAVTHADQGEEGEEEEGTVGEEEEGE